MPPVCRWILSSVTLVVTELVSLSLHPSSNFATLNKVPASFGWGKGENVTSAVWQVTLWCHSDVWVPIMVRCVACYFSLLSNVCARTHTPVNCHFQVNLEVCQSRMDAPLLLFFSKNESLAYYRLDTLLVSQWLVSMFSQPSFQEWLQILFSVTKVNVYGLVQQVSTAEMLLLLLLGEHHHSTERSMTWKYSWRLENANRQFNATHWLCCKHVAICFHWRVASTFFKLWIGTLQRFHWWFCHWLSASSYRGSMVRLFIES